MESAVLVDSNVFIDLLRQRRDPATELLSRSEIDDLATCGMVRLEVVRGLIHPKLRRAVEEFMSVMLNVITDNKLWEEATELAWKLDRQGRTIPTPDLVIAASALRIDAAVLTFDRHFDAVPGLRIYHTLEELG